MGGCKCSYRECKVSSDFKTHFFHYPVLDEKRCQQWMTNARKPEFQYLTPTQLRNRVICQHHFKDNMFMNFKHNKLVHNAVPTEGGASMRSTDEDIKENLKIIPKSTATSLDLDLPSNNKEETTLIVNESPFNGYTFLQPENKIQKTSENYVEILTRKSEGLVEIARRRMLENFNQTKNKPNILSGSKKSMSTKSAKYVKKDITENQDLQITGNLDPTNKPVNSADVKVDIDNTNTIHSKNSVNTVEEIKRFEKQSISPNKLINVISNKKLSLNVPLSKNLIADEFRLHSKSNINPVLADLTKINSSIDLYHEPYPTPAQVLHLPNIKSGEIKDSKNILKNGPKDKTNAKLAHNTKNRNTRVCNVVEVPVIFTVPKDKNSSSSLPSNNVECQYQTNVATPEIVPSTIKSDKIETIHENIPVEVKVSLNLIDKIEQNSREIAELKNLIINGCETRAKNKKKRIRRQNTDDETRKVELYEEISRFLSPGVASLVHNEMFPRKRRKVCNSNVRMQSR